MIEAQLAPSADARHRILKTLPIETRSIASSDEQGRSTIVREYVYKGVVRLRVTAAASAEVPRSTGAGERDLSYQEDGSPSAQPEFAPIISCEDISPDNEVFQGDCATQQETDDWLMEQAAASAEVDAAESQFEDDSYWYCTNKIDYDWCGSETESTILAVADERTNFEIAYSEGLPPTFRERRQFRSSMEDAPPSCYELAAMVPLSIGATRAIFQGGAWIVQKIGGSFMVTRLALMFVGGMTIGAALFAIGAAAAAAYCFYNQ